MFEQEPRPRARRIRLLAGLLGGQAGQLDTPVLHGADYIGEAIQRSGGQQLAGQAPVPVAANLIMRTHVQPPSRN